MKKNLIYIFVAFIFFAFPKLVFATESNKFVTIVNPVRVSSYTKYPELSVKSEYEVIRSNNLPATWLLTYDALDNKNVLSIIKKMDKKQEFGIFLEVTKDFATNSGVLYNDTGFWQHANSVFLSGYSQEDRRKMIDTVFEKFKLNFGYYPKSVGSWWTDSYSLSYTRGKYGIIANLVCSDQYSTDGYQIWGQPWEVPYYPSRYSSNIPADVSNKLDVVNIQWAPRDPLNGYYSSLFSTQDYLVAPQKQDINYFKKLIDTYLSVDDGNGFSQIVVGLEGDLDPTGYKDEFAKQINYIREISDRTNIVTMTDFSNWYRQAYSNISPDYQIVSNDLLEKNVQSFWFGNQNYRLFYTKDKDKVVIRDLRVYLDNIEEPNYISPNYQFYLSENIPAVIDSISNPKDSWVLPSDSVITTNRNTFLISGENLKIPENIRKSKLVHVENSNDKIVISLQNINGISLGGMEIKDFSAEAIHFFKQKLAIFYLLTGRGWNYLKKMTYSIPNGEIYALEYLASQPKGSILVYDGECLQCLWHTKFKPPAFSNLRSYVSRLTGYPIVYNKSIFDAKNQLQAKEEFQKTKTRYIYLVRFESYTEKLPFSPGDLGIQKIFSNANAEIWEVRSSAN